MKTPTKYESTTQPGLFYWAEAATENSFAVVMQADGYPATEAADDWFAKFEDADEIAQQMAAGKYVP